MLADFLTQRDKRREVSLDAQCEQIIADDPERRSRRERIKTIPGVGLLTSSALLVLYRSDRPYMDLVGVAGSVPGAGSAGSATNPFEMYSGIRQAQYPFGGLIRPAARRVLVRSRIRRFAPMACSVRSFRVRPLVRPRCRLAATGYYDSSLLAPLEGHQYFGRFHYDLTDNLQAYVHSVEAAAV